MISLQGQRMLKKYAIHAQDLWVAGGRQGGIFVALWRAGPQFVGGWCGLKSRALVCAVFFREISYLLPLMKIVRGLVVGS